MRIDIDKILGVSKIYKSLSSERNKNVKEASRVNGKRDQLSVSQKAKDYQIVLKGIKALNDIPDIREAKVNEIKEKMDKGIYDVDGKDIAEKILSSHFDKRI